MEGRPLAERPNELDDPPLRYFEIDGVYPVREDSLLILETVMRRMAGERIGRYLDMGCGTGLCSIAASLNGWEVWSADRNPRALALTRKNLALNRLEPRLLLTDLFSGVPEAFKGSFDLISFNPPYLEDDSAFPIPMDHTALFGGGSGIGVALAFVVGGMEYLAKGGEMIMVLPREGYANLSEVLEGSRISISILKEAAGSEEGLMAFSVGPLKTC